MYSYAWANPITGIREQAETLEMAKSILWEELQSARATLESSGVSGDRPRSRSIWQRKEVGTVGKTTHSVIDEPSSEWTLYLFASPINGALYVLDNRAFTISRIADQLRDAQAGIDDVVVYLAREAARVKREDPRPESPAPMAPRQQTPSDLLKQAHEGSLVDQGHATTLAFLWTAEALQKIATWCEHDREFDTAMRQIVRDAKIPEAPAAESSEPTDQQRAEMRAKFVKDRAPMMSQEDLSELAKQAAQALAAVDSETSAAAFSAMDLPHRCPRCRARVEVIGALCERCCPKTTVQ